MIIFEYETDFPLPDDWDEQKVRTWLEECIRKFQVKLDSLVFTFLDDERMREVNRAVFNRDYYTDTVTLTYDTGETLSGEIYISLPRVRENAQKFETTYANELLRVMIHSFLHTLGYNDYTDDEKKQMRCWEDECLRYYGL